MLKNLISDVLKEYVESGTIQLSKTNSTCELFSNGSFLKWSVMKLLYQSGSFC